MAVQLRSPRVRVVLGDPDDPVSWTEHEVQILGRDMQATEVLLKKLRLGALGDNAIGGQAMFAFHALRRTGKIPTDLTWNEFQEVYLEVTGVGEDQEVTPTVPAAGPGS